MTWWSPSILFHILVLCVVCAGMCGVLRGWGPHLPATLTDEEDGKGDKEEEDVWHHIERIQETAVVQNPSVYIVGHRVILVATERQGHGGAGTLNGTGQRKRSRWRQRRDREVLIRGSQSMSRFQKGLLVIPQIDFWDFRLAPSWIKLPIIGSSEREETEGEGVKGSHSPVQQQQL